jgi:hypothetical protein
MSDAETLNPTLDRIQRPALIVGLAGAVLCLLGWFISREQFYQSYLMAYLFWIGLALGSTAILMLQHLTGGAWGLVIRRGLETGTRMIPLMAILFIPILLGMHHLYIWTHDDHVATDELLQHKRRYLNVGGFVARAVIYFAIWLVLTFLLNRWSAEQDRTGDPRIARRMAKLSGPGLVLYVLTMTFASVDWVMSIDPHWFSTIYGLLFIVGQGLSTLAFMVALLVIVGGTMPLLGVLRRDHFHDLGNLLLAFTMLWAYVSFSQFLIIWSGNIAEETPFYYYRSGSGWQVIAIVLIVFHFFMPFCLLLWRKSKRSPRMLAGIAGLIIVMRLVDLYWTIMPTFLQAQGHLEHRDPLIIPGVSLHWLNFVMPVAIGGIWIAVYIWQLKRHPLLPLHDPRLEALEEEGHHG